MANELQASSLTGQTIYAVLWDSTDHPYYTTGTAFEAYNAVHWAAYAIALAEQGASGHYAGTMPTVAAGLYNPEIRLQLGGSPATSDPAIGAGIIGWSGTAEVPPAALGSDGRVLVSADAHTSGETVANITSKTGYALASTGLDAVSTADITSDSDGRSTFPKMLRALFNRMFNANVDNGTSLTVANDAGTVVSTMTVSDNGSQSTKSKST